MRFLFLKSTGYSQHSMLVLVLLTLLQMVLSSAEVYGQSTIRYSDLVATGGVKDRISAFGSTLMITNPPIGVFVGTNPDSLYSPLTSEQFNSVYRGTLTAVSASGVMAIAGLDKYLDSARVFIWDRIGGTSHVIRCNSDAGWIVHTLSKNDLDAFPSGALHFLNGYSMDGGTSWSFANPPAPIIRWTRVYHQQGFGFYAFHSDSKSWFQLDLETLQWSKMDIPEDLVDLLFLSNGRMIGVESKHKYDDTRGSILYRDSGETSWRRIDTVTRSDGKKLTLMNSITGTGPLIEIADTLIAVPLDSGLVVVVSQDQVHTATLPDETYESELKSRSEMYNASNGAEIAVIYSNKTVCVFDAAKLENAHIYHPQYNNINEIEFHAGRLIGQSANSVRVLFVMDERNGEWQPTGRVVESSPIVPAVVEMASLQQGDGRILFTTVSGCIVQLDTGDFSTAVLGLLFPLPNSLTSEDRFIFGDQRVRPIQQATATMGTALNLIPGGVKYRDTCTAFYEASNGDWYAGYRHLVHTATKGTSWDTITVLGRSDENDGCLGAVASRGKSILVGYKGYERRVDTEPVDTIHGGIYCSQDGGASWHHAILPGTVDWIDNIAFITDDLCLAWASSMALVGDTAPDALRAFI